MKDTVILNGVTLFSEGRWQKGEYEGGFGDFCNVVSDQYNKLKAQLYNLVESSVTDEKQREAMKGLIKGFCNEAYRETEKSIEYLFGEMGFKMEKTPIPSQPLENID